MIADILTFSRMAASLSLLMFPVYSRVFTALYLFCGISDVLDGIAARKLHTESEKGAKLDSTADLLFSVVYALRILPGLSIPLWIWIWIALIAVCKTAVILCSCSQAHGFRINHSRANKLTGLLIWTLPLTVKWIEPKYSSIIVCTAACFAVVSEAYSLKGNFS